MISGLFMLWAIFRLQSSIKQTPMFKEMLNQKMIKTHFITLVIYLLSVLVYYIFYATWNDTQNRKKTNEMYVSWTLSVIFMWIVQAVLIYISWVLSTDEQWVSTDENGTTTQGSDDTETNASGRPKSSHRKSEHSKGS